MAHNESFSEFSAVIGLPDLNWGCPTWDFASFQDVVETWCGSRGRWANVHESGSVPTAGKAWWTTMPDGAKVTRVSCLFFYFSHCLRSMVDRLIGGESYAWWPPLMYICIPFVLTCAVDSKLFCGETFSESRLIKVCILYMFVRCIMSMDTVKEFIFLLGLKAEILCDLSSGQWD
jgi:hypothetical protein